MKEKLWSLDQQVEKGFQLGRRFSVPFAYLNVENIFFCGIGGSAIGGDILKELVFTQSKIPFVVSRGLSVPGWVGKKTLAIFSSYSGNTWETIETFKRVSRLGAKIVILTSGGFLKALAEKRGMPHLVVPAGLPPRFAIGYLTFTLMPLLVRGGWLDVTSRDITKVITIIKSFRRAKACAIARQFAGKCVSFYGTSGFMEPVAQRWKAQLAENSKMLASHHPIPEMFHNEIEGWRFPKVVLRNSVAVFLVDAGEPELLHKKRRLAQQVIRRKGVRVLEIQAPRMRPVPRIFSLIHLADWVSYELARLNGVDPVPIPAIELIKRER